MAPDNIQTPGQPRLNAYAVTDGVYPLVELRTFPCRDGGIEYAVRCFPIDGEDFGEDTTLCPRHARMLFLAASGIDIDEPVRRGRA